MTPRKKLQELKGLIVAGIKFPFNLLGLNIVRKTLKGGLHGDYRQFIPFHPVMAAARQAGLSLGDYIDQTYNVPGATLETINHLKDLGVFDQPIERVCEIGPGTGRYLEKVLAITQPSYCEIYETAKDWETWLVQEYQVVAQPADGISLSNTPSNSIDLVLAHKVMPGQPSLIICRYFAEMTRVVRRGGKVVFDIVTEDCLDDFTLKSWWDCGSTFESYPCLFPKQFAVSFFTSRGFSFDGSFIAPMKPGKTEVLVFTNRCP